jgi:hypothetical protein
MHAAWVPFATSGDPGWPKYDLSRRATMRLRYDLGGRGRPSDPWSGSCGRGCARTEGDGNKKLALSKEPSQSSDARCSAAQNIDPLYSIFPLRREWPPAVDDVAKAPPDTRSIRLISGARGFDKLPSYRNLKALWCFNINENRLRSICGCTSLESLYIENIKTENLCCLRELTNLRLLGLESCSRATSLEVVSKLRSLSGLAITHFKNVHDLGPLAELSSLRTLAVAGSMWTRMRVNSFKPLEGLRNLELLHLTNIKAEDESLRPFGGLRNLKHLDLANFYPMSEFAWLSQRLRRTECTWFQPYIEMKHIECNKCKKETKVLLTGKRKPTLCSQCDKKALEKHVRDWNELAEKAA